MAVWDCIVGIQADSTEGSYGNKISYLIHRLVGNDTF